MLEIAGWALAGLKGSQTIEGVFDQAAAQLKQQMAQKAAMPPQPPPPDPKVQAAQVKAGAEQFKAKADVASTQLDMQAKVAQHQMDMQKLAAEHATSMASAEADQRAQGVAAVRSLIPSSHQ
jgi:hypothetical protein